jgi:hypothetical protein
MVRIPEGNGTVYSMLYGRGRNIQSGTYYTGIHNVHNTCIYVYIYSYIINVCMCMHACIHTAYNVNGALHSITCCIHVLLTVHKCMYTYILYINTYIHTYVL